MERPNACCLIGFMDMPLNDTEQKKLAEKIIDLIKNKAVCKFYVGNFCCFDDFCLTVLKELQTMYHLEIHRITPFDNDWECFKPTIFSDEKNKISYICATESRFPKVTHTKAIKYMLDNSSYMIYHGIEDRENSSTEWLFIYADSLKIKSYNVSNFSKITGQL